MVQKLKSKRSKSSRPQHLKRNLGLLKAISLTKQCDHKAVASSLHNDCIKCLSDCSYNILQGHVKLSSKEKKLLKPFCKVLCQLTNSDISTPNKKKLIIKQKGGFLGFLIKPVLSLIGLLGGAIGSK